jgi:hypothetical protein
MMLHYKINATVTLMKWNVPQHQNQGIHIWKEHSSNLNPQTYYSKIIVAFLNPSRHC